MERQLAQFDFQLYKVEFVGDTSVDPSTFFSGNSNYDKHGRGPFTARPISANQELHLQRTPGLALRNDTFMFLSAPQRPEYEALPPQQELPLTDDFDLDVPRMDELYGEYLARSRATVNTEECLEEDVDRHILRCSTRTTRAIEAGEELTRTYGVEWLTRAFIWYLRPIYKSCVRTKIRERPHLFMDDLDGSYRRLKRHLFDYILLKCEDRRDQMNVWNFFKLIAREKSVDVPHYFV